MLKNFLRIVLILIVVILGVFGAWAIWERNREPLPALDTIADDIKVVNSFTLRDSTIAGLRDYQTITLFSQKSDTIRAIISFPPRKIEKPLPVVTILGGLEIGRKNFSFIPDPGDNILIIYMYPYSPEYWYEGHALQEVPRIRNGILNVPAQITELSRWVQKQSWCDTSRVSLLGYSFGSLFLPAVERLAARHNVRSGPMILAYGGVDIEMLLYENLRVKPLWLRRFSAWLAATAIYTVDPLHHAPRMHGDIYIINGTEDSQIPDASWKKLQNLVPSPDKIDILPGAGHMHPRKPELTAKLVRMSRAWLKEKGVLNP